ncbi:MAG: hypothetical protein J6D42_06275 [Clostridia bacterium]|nr:hypothetical protein [Clostridia bacterium]
MKKSVLIFISFILFLCLIVGCSNNNAGGREESSVKVTTLIADDFREKTAAAEKWAAENVDIAENDSYKRHESDVLTVGNVTYLCVNSWETNGMVEVPSYQLEKYVNGERTVLIDVGQFGFGGDFPISIVKDSETVLLAVMGSSINQISTWNNAGKIVVTYGNGEIEVIEYSFDSEEKDFYCEFVHQLESSDISSLIFVSSPDRYSGVTTRLFELDEDQRIVFARVVNGDGAFDEDYSVNEPVPHVFPELFE